MAGLFIKFDPDQIHSVSTLLSTQQGRLAQAIQNINNKAQSLASAWNGDSETAYLQKINDLKTQGSALTQTLTTLSQNLDAASGIYRNSENAAKQQSGSLPTTGIFNV